MTSKRAKRGIAVRGRKLPATGSDAVASASHAWPAARPPDREQWSSPWAIWRFTAVLAAWLVVLTCRGAAPPLTGDIRDVHDPCLIKQGEYYYLFSTGNGITIRRSRDRQDWQNIGPVFGRAPEWTFREVPGFAGHIWAPDIHLVGDEYRLYYSVSTFGSNRSCIGLAVNRTLDPATPEYRWVDQGVVVRSQPGRDDWNAIDPNLVVTDQGAHWLSFGSFCGGIKLIALDPRTGKPAADPPHVLPLASRPGARAIEAPFIIQREGFYYLLVSFDFCCRGAQSNYKIMVGRSRAVEGPYLDRADRPLLTGGGTLLLAGYGSIRGPGHNAVLREAEGDWLVHHFYDGDRNGVPTLQIRPLLWDPDGWPLVGEPGVTPLRANPALAAKEVAGDWQHAVDFRPARVIRLLPDGHIGSPRETSTWALEGNWLVLKWPDAAAPGGQWLDRCFVEPHGQWYVGRNQDGTPIRGTRVH